MSKKKRKASRRRKVSSAVLAALARGRKKLASMRQKPKRARRKKFHPYAARLKREHDAWAHPFKKDIANQRRREKRARRKIRSYIPPSQEPLIITKGESIMSGRRRRRHHKKACRSYGFEGRKRHRRSRRRYYGADRASPTNTVINGAVAVGGGVLASMASHYIPVTNAKLKALVPVAIGAVLAMLPMTRRNKMLQSAALGAVVVGGMSLVRQLAPNVPLLTGDLYQGTDYFIPSQGEQEAFLGYPAQVAGDNLDGGDLDGELMGIPY